MNKKLLLGILILGLIVIGAACSQNPVAIENTEPSVSEDEFLEEEEEKEEELEFLEGEIVDKDGGQFSELLIGEVDFNQDLFDPFIDMVRIGKDDEDDIDKNISIRAFNMIAKQFKFVPGTIKVKRGNKVVLNITSTDVEHGFAIDEYGINKTIPARKSVVIEFIADKAGTFEFYCSVYCGVGHSSMRGKLIIE